MWIQSPTVQQPSEVMMRILDALLAVGILINLIKGAELLLRPHQQSWLQDKCDTLALWLEDSRPVRWYMKPNVPLRIHRLAGSVFVLIGGMGYALFAESRLWVTIIIIIAVTLLCTFMFTSAFDDSDIEKTAPDSSGRRYRALHGIRARDIVVRDKLTEWLLDSPNFGTHLLKQGLLGVAGLLGFAGFMAIVIGVAYAGRYFNSLGRLRIWQVLIITGLIILIAKVFFYVESVATPFIAMGCVSALSFLFTLSLVVTELFLKLTRGIVWRVAEYNKGAFAAILLIATGLLGVAEAYLRFLKK